MTHTGLKTLGAISLGSVLVLGACGTPASSTPAGSQGPATTDAPSTDPTTATPTDPTSTPATSTSSTPSDTSSTTVAAGPTRCQGAALTGRVVSTSAAAGHARLVVALRNTGPRCYVEGYPEVTLLAAPGGQPVATWTTTDGGVYFPSVTPRNVTLGSGDEASFDLGFSRVPTGGGRCVTASALKVSLPQAGGSVEVRANVYACRDGMLAVSPVVAGSAGV